MTDSRSNVVAVVIVIVMVVVVVVGLLLLLLVGWSRKMKVASKPTNAVSDNI